jgi:hypothetical protein
MICPFENIENGSWDAMSVREVVVLLASFVQSYEAIVAVLVLRVLIICYLYSEAINQVTPASVEPELYFFLSPPFSLLFWVLRVMMYSCTQASARTSTLLK